MIDDLVCRKCGSREVAQRPMKELPGALRSYCPDCGSEEGYIPFEKYQDLEDKNWWSKLLKSVCLKKPKRK